MDERLSGGLRCKPRSWSPVLLTIDDPWRLQDAKTHSTLRGTFAINAGLDAQRVVHLVTQGSSTSWEIPDAKPVNFHASIDVGVLLGDDRFGTSLALRAARIKTTVRKATTLTDARAAIRNHMFSLSVPAAIA